MVSNEQRLQRALAEGNLKNVILKGGQKVPEVLTLRSFVLEGVSWQTAEKLNGQRVSVTFRAGARKRLRKGTLVAETKHCECCGPSTTVTFVF